MAKIERVPLTQEGYDKMKQEINQLKSVERPRIVQEIEEARAHGDLSENAEYHAAKEKMGHVMGRIQDLEHQYSKAEVIDPKKMIGQTKVMFGAKVNLLDVNTDEEISYQIVGDYEASIENGKISVSSPIARAIIGKNLGDTVSVKAPKGIRELEIVGVVYG